MKWLNPLKICSHCLADARGGEWRGRGRVKNEHEPKLQEIS